jgi:hypothetical protein
MQLRLDNGPELISRTLADWPDEHEVALALIQSGKSARMLLLSASIARIVNPFSMPFYLILSQRLRRLLKIGWRNITRFGRMRHWVMCHPTKIPQNSHEFSTFNWYQNWALFMMNILSSKIILLPPKYFILLSDEYRAIPLMLDQYHNI